MTMQHIDPATASGETKEVFDEVVSQFGAAINLFKIAANAPNILKGLLALNKQVTASTELDGKLIEQVAMLVSALNSCDYCVNVHMQVGQKYGLTEQNMIDALNGKADSPKAQALLTFAYEVVKNRGQVSDESFMKARNAGFSDKALLETVGLIGFYTTIQYIRHVGNPDHDFPEVTAFNPSQHAA